MSKYYLILILNELCISIFVFKYIIYELLMINYIVTIE